MKVETRKLIGDTLFVMLCISVVWMTPVAVIEMVTDWQDLAEASRADQAVMEAGRLLVSAAKWPLSEEEWGVWFMQVAALGDEAAVLRDQIRAGHRAPRDAKGHLYKADELMTHLRAIEETAKRAGYMPAEYRSP